MALIADHAADRAEQLALITERLTALIDQETQRIDARLPPPLPPTPFSRWGETGFWLAMLASFIGLVIDVLRMRAATRLRT